jgi:hypothetical protein
MSLRPEHLLGTWELDSYRIEFSDGPVDEPFGASPVGLLHYGQDGFMAAHIMTKDREPLGDTASASPEAARAALASHFSYCGSYRVEGGTVVHDVTISVSPEWCGTTKTRVAVLDGDVMTLRAPDTSFGLRTGSAVLRWRRSGIDA